MRRRGKASGKTLKKGRSKASARNTLKSARGLGSTVGCQETEVVRLTQERDELLEQQTASSDVLKIIASSTGELTPVFTAILENATRLCEAEFGTLFLHTAGAFHYAADVGAPPEYTEFQRRRGPFQTTPGSQLDKVLRTKRVNYTSDSASESVIGVSGRLGGARSSIAVPLLKGAELVGALFIYRTEVQPFTDRQIALVM